MIRDTGTIGNQTFSGGNGSNGTGSGNGSNQERIKTATSKDSRSSSQDIDLEDRLSSTSDSSMSHRLNDLGDVQHLARMQEESKSAPKIFIPKYYKHRTAIWANKKRACLSDLLVHQLILKSSRIITN